MRSTLFLAGALTAALGFCPVWAAESLCDQVNVFEQEPLTKLPDGGLQRRWMDFSWGAPKNLAKDEVQIGATLKCHGSDVAAEKLCKYALQNTPHENMSALPLGILRCHGFVAGKAAFPSRWVEELSWDAPNDLIENIQIDQLARQGFEPSMRLTIMPFPESPRAKKPEPFFKPLSSKLDLWDQGAE
jgi:hypothetical protein